MVAIITLFFLTSLLSSSTASPIYQIGEVIGEVRDFRAESRLESRAGNLLTGQISFQTVTTSQSQAGTITQTCEVTLTPVTANDGTPAVLHQKECKFSIGNGGGQQSSSSAESSTAVETSTSSQVSVTETSTSLQETQAGSSTISSSSAAETAPPAISEIGTNVIPASGSTTQESSSVTQSSVTTSESAAPPVVSVVGPSSISNTGNPVITASDSSATTTGTEPITVVTTLSNGQVSTAISTPSAAAAEAAAATPGRKLEVLPIGLGVFAGVSVIALIVVGLVTYERTKYRKAFRKRKLAEAGAQMGFGGVAERR